MYNMHKLYGCVIVVFSTFKVVLVIMVFDRSVRLAPVVYCEYYFTVFDIWIWDCIGIYNKLVNK